MFFRSRYFRSDFFGARFFGGEPPEIDGIVEVFEGLVSLGTAPVVAGVAQISGITSFTAGSHLLRAVYTPTDPLVLAAESAIHVHVVTAPAAQATTITLTTDPDPSVWMESVTLVATVDSATGTPVGTVSFFANGVFVGSAPTIDGVATLNTTGLPVGTLTLTAGFTPTDPLAFVSSVTGGGGITHLVLDESLPSLLNKWLHRRKRRS